MDKPWRILVIDDEVGIREGCRRALNREGYEVEAAATAQGGLKAALDDGFDLILLDVMMPDGSGIDLLQPLLQRDPDLVCVIITGFATVELAVQAIKQGAYDFISKPFTSDTLVMAVNQGLERRRLTLEAREAEAHRQRAEELARAKADLEKLDRIKSQFMLTVAHELRAPVAAIQSYVNLILAGYATPEAGHSMLQRAQVRTQELLDLIEDLVNLARLKQAPELSAQKQSPQDLAAILEAVVGTFRPQAEEKGQTLSLDIQARPTIMGSEQHLRQVWTNLVSNAIKYTPDHGQIWVSLQASSDGRGATGRVRDTGIGISEEDQAHLFQEFFRTAEAKASGQIGTGLGLSIVRQIVEMYGGRISVESQPGEGSCFEFWLPVEPSAPDPASPGEDQPLVPA